jgi:ribosome-associated protein
MDEGLHIRGSIVIPAHELTWKFSRSSGPGGQSVNTTDSRVQLLFDVTKSASIPEYLRTRALDRLDGKLVDGCLVVAASEHRSQFQNRRAAERRLADTLREAMAPPPRVRRPTKPSRAATDRRIKEKKSRGMTKRLRGIAGRDE